MQFFFLFAAAAQNIHNFESHSKPGIEKDAESSTNVFD